MIKLMGNDITRGGQKIGWFSGNDIYDEEGRKLGYFSDNDIYRADGRKMGYIEDNYINMASGKTMRLDENRKRVSGGSASDLLRAAIRLLIGD